MAVNGIDLKGSRKYNEYLNKVIDKTKRSIRYIAFFSLFINLLMLTVPIYMLQIFDRVIPSHSFDTLIYLTLIAAFMLLVFGLLDRARAHIMIKISAWLGQALGPEALMRGPDKILHGEQMVSQTLQDIGKVRAFLSSPALTMLFDAPWMPIYLVVIFFLHPTLGVISVIGAVLLLLLALANEMSTRKLSEEASIMAIKSQHHVTATLKNAEAIQAMGMMPSIVDNWSVDNDETTDKQTKAGLRSSTILSTSKMIRMMLQVIMLGAGAYYVVKGVFTPGVMIAGTILLSRALAPVEQGIGAWKQFIAAREAYQRLKHYFFRPILRPDAMELPPPKGDLSVEALYFVPPGADKAVLENVSFKLNAGDILAVIGPSAAGKTSLARILVGAWEPTRGHARLDGADIYEWDREDFGRYVGYLPQDVELFVGTVSQNIARLGEVDPEAVVDAAKRAEAHEMILNLPHGYDTDLISAGQTLSGGQRQRIGLARALYKHPRLVVLDEPNASLDELGLKALMDSIGNMRKNKRTVILITHHPALLQCVDKILLMKEGKVLGIGPAKEVLAKIAEQQKPPAQASDQGKGQGGSGGIQASFTLG